MKRYETYKDSGVEWIGEIPNSWIGSKLKYYADVITGNTPSMKFENYYSLLSGVPWVKPNDLNQFKPIISSKQFLTEEGSNEARIVRKGSVLVGGIGDIGKLGIAGIDITTNQQIHSIEGNLNKMNDDFLKYLIYNSIDALQKASSSVVLSILTKTKLLDLEIVIPSLKEQTQIANYLDYKTGLIDSIIAQKEDLIQKLKELRFSLVEKVLIDKTIKRTQLRYVVNLTNRPIVYNEDEEYTKIGMYNWNRGLFLYPKTLGQDLGDSVFQIIREGDLIISGQFAWEGSVSLVTDNENECIASHRFHVLNGKNEIILNEYLMAYFTSQEGHFILNDNSNGSAGRNRPLNINALLKEKIPIPNLDIQMEIKEVIKKEQENIIHSFKIIQKLKEYRQSLISEAVTGKIDVRDWQAPKS
jgi:type I restriction enzyme S subunit